MRERGRVDGAPGLNLQVRVRPGASRTRVGGAHDAALVVRVQAPAVDGRATEAALRAVADAFGLKRADVALVSGPSARTKVLRLTGDPGELEGRRDELLGSG
jgi:uncharacterized protein (TIGR00251 family)